MYGIACAPTDCTTSLRIGSEVEMDKEMRTVGKKFERDVFRYSVTKGVALISIDRPPLNVLSFSHYHALSTKILQAIESKEAKAVVVTGSNKAFISGLDIEEISRIRTPAENNRATLAVKILFRKIEKLPRPVIAAINGNCFGGGLELAMACHLRVASRDARLGLPEINLAAIPSFGGTQRLPKIVGKAKALELILTGRLLSGDEAASIGLVNEACPAEGLLERTVFLAHQIASKSVMAVEAATRATTEALEVDIERGGSLESRLSSELTGTYNMKEGLAASFEKRKPVFRDR
jgi:enoyl-CoA hydratase